MQRRQAFRAADGAEYDVAIVGAGISGARIFHELNARGRRALLFDRGDFAGGTSQASGMMIWGGLLYLKDFDLPTVLKLCRARDALIDRMPETVRVQGLRYLPAVRSRRNRHIVRAGMWLYWLLGSARRSFPGCEAAFAGLDMLKAGRFRDSLTFEEAVLRASDCRFALEWILPGVGAGSAALNHCAAETMRLDAAAGRWRLELRDRLHGHKAAVSARFVVNAAGAWTDSVNEVLGVESPFRHELSKGVYLGFRRPAGLREILVFDSGKNDGTLTFVPWGPVALCGPTETRIEDLREGFSVTPEDVRWLLRAANRNLHAQHSAGDIVSLRCGVRPLAVHRDAAAAKRPSALSRKHEIYFDRARQAIAVYGGKLTSCGLLAGQVCERLRPALGPGRESPLPAPEPPPTVPFPGLGEPVPDAAWCRDREHCHTLEDYLRRRTNIAQWLPRGGLGAQSEYLPSLRALARVFAEDNASADRALAACEAQVRERHDAVLAAV